MHQADRRQRFADTAAAVGLIAGLLLGCAGAPDQAAVPDPPVLPLPVGADAVSLAERALTEGRLDDANTLLRRAMLSGGATARARLVAAELHLAAGALNAAAAAFGDLTGDSDVAARALQGKGIALTLAGGDMDAGLASLRAAVALDPHLWRAWNVLGFHYDLRGDWRRAAESYDRALALNPTSAIILNNRGFSMLLQGRAEAAIADFDQALRRDPALVPARENMRLALAWAGAYGRALAGVEHSGMARALNNVGFMALLRGDQTSAETYFLRAIEIDPAFNQSASQNLAYLKQVRDGDTGAPPLRRQ